MSPRRPAGSAPASGCRKRVWFLRLFPESFRVPRNTLGRFFSLALHRRSSPGHATRVQGQGSHQTGRKTNNHEHGLFHQNPRVAVLAGPVPDKSGVEVQRSTKARDKKQAEAILAGWALQAHLERQPGLCQARVRRVSAEMSRLVGGDTPRWRPTEPPVTPSWRGARRWGTKPTSTAGARSRASTLAWTNSARGGRGYPVGGRDAADCGGLPRQLPRQGPGTRNGETEAGSPALTLGGDDTGWLGQAEPGNGRKTDVWHTVYLFPPTIQFLREFLASTIASGK